MDLKKFKKFFFSHNIKGKHRFTSRVHGYEKMCIILIGYKTFLWDDIIGRFIAFAPKDIDVCLVSSGKYLPELEDMARQYDWSYLSIKKNNVCLAQNIAISKFPDANYIYKMDEDIFLTEGSFEKLMNVIHLVENETPYTVGVASPLLNINAYGYRRILEKTGALNEFIKRFGAAPLMSGQREEIERNSHIATFLWGEDGFIPQIDKMNNDFNSTGEKYSICPIRSSIGFILMKRSFWEFIGGFPVVFGNGMGLDETYLIGACSSFSHVFAIAENSVVGHFGYGGQGAAMKEYYNNHPEVFKIK